MGLPRKLKNYILFRNGVNYAGEIAEVTLPTLTRKMEGYRGGGMGGEVKYDMGQEPIELEWMAGGFLRALFDGYGATRHDAELLRFAGAYQRDDTGQAESVEIVVRGRTEEIDPGSHKAGDDTEIKVKTVCSYYKLLVAGVPLIEIDLVNNILVVNGEDRMSEIREALGVAGLAASIDTTAGLTTGF